MTNTVETRASFLVRTAWRWLLAPALIVVLFGIGDIILGNEADPAIVEGLTGLTFEEIEELSPEAATVIDLQARSIGLALVALGSAISAIVFFGFRKWQRWAWFTAWVLPVWSIGVATIMVLVDRPVGGPIPPPMISGPIFFAYGVFWLAVSYRGFSRPSSPSGA